MGVTITDPSNNDFFPDAGGDDWTAYVTIDCADSVDGLLYDYNTSNLYQSTGPICTGGPDSNGIYTWQVPFGNQDLTGISANDTLLIYCYDVVNGNGASCADTASQAGGAGYEFASPEPEKKKLHEHAPSITITDATAITSPTTVSVTVKYNLPLPTKGFIFLVLANLATRRILVQALPSGVSTQTYPFSITNANQWTYIDVLAVIEGYTTIIPPQKKQLKPPPH